MLLTSALAVLFSAKVISQMLDDEYTTLAKIDELLMLYVYTLY